MSLPEISIRKPVLAWMIMFALMLFGILSYFKIGVSQLPDVDFPMVNVGVTYEGAAPEVMELDIIDPIESAIMSVEGVKSITSSAKMGSASISVEFGLEKNIDVAVTEVQTKLNQAAKRLPKDADPPTISKVNPEDRPILWLSVMSEQMSRKDLMAYVRDNLRDKIQTLPGVADVFLGGYVDPNLRVWVDSQKLNQYELTASDLIQTIQTEHKESPSGYIEDEKSEKNVRTLGEAKSIQEFNQLPIIRRGGAHNFRPLFLGDVAIVEEGLAEIRRISRVNGKTGVGIGVRKQRGANAVEIAKTVKAKILELEKTLPMDLKLGVNFDMTKHIEDSIHEILFTLVLSSVLTAIVCWLFLGSLGATINVVFAIPTSILGAFIFIKYFNFTLNTFTLLALSLSIGIVVDDAIMILENIYRHKEMGKNRLQASLEGANEIQFAALSATIAIMAIFIPVALMDGVIGKYFYQFGITISVAVALSYIEAVTLTPMRTSKFMEEEGHTSKLGQKVDQLFVSLNNSYSKILDVALNHKWKTIGFSLVFFVGTFFLVKLIPKEFVPAQDTSSFMIRLKTKDGSSLEYTDQKLKEVEIFLSQRQEVIKYFGSVGGFGGGESNSAMLFVTLKDPKDRPVDAEANKKLTQLEIIEAYRKHFKSFKGGKVFIQDTSQGGFSASGRGFPVEFTIVGPNWDELARLSKVIMKEMEETKTFADVDTDFKASVFEIQIFPDREKAKARGVSVQEIGSTINALIGGVVVGKYSKDGHRFDIRLKMKDFSKEKIDDLKKINVRNTRGELVPLLDVVTVKELPGSQSITRKDRSRAISIFSGIAKNKSQADALEQAKIIAKRNLPAGYSLVESGSSESFKQSFRSLIFALILGIIVAYMILGAQFNSFIDPITVLMALPFSFSGAFIGLYFMGQSLNIYSMIGLILLMGIVKKNSILIVDFTNQKKNEGLQTLDALKQACPQRLRPILMTTISTVAGAMPLAFSIGPGSEALSPMAVSVIGGSLVSTVLSLIVVPCVYLAFANLAKKK
jgi:hydrophobe/amphiphile efflux-1 (HAE1) family protein